MISLEQFSELLDVLYSAPLDHNHWHRFLSLLCEHTGSNTGVFLCADSGSGLTLRVTGGAPLDPEIVLRYNEKYSNTDPFRNSLIRKARPGIFHGEDLLPNEALLRTPLYRELVSQLGFRYATVVSVSLSVRSFEAISIWRAPELGQMSEDGIRMLTLLLPHIQKALEISRVLGVAQQRLAQSEIVTDASHTPTFLVTQDGRVIYRNAAADNLLSEGSAISLRSGFLAAVVRDSGTPLRLLVQRASTLPASFESPGMHALPLPRSDGRQPMHLIASPLPQAQRNLSGADVLLLITDPERNSSFPDNVLRSLYGLTSAETEIANGLLMGYSLSEVASLRRVSTGTVRVQVKSLLSKTGTSRQSELMRVLMSVPQMPASK
ncbi:MAG TPA: hypothetical protein VIJ79_08860 [Acidobacteriaceae bacterium]